jgi:uncharacterized protein (TIGR02145 family)
MTEISNDMENDGEWNEGHSATTKVKIADWAMVADIDGRLAIIRDNVKNWGLGVAPDFAKFIRNYWHKEHGIDDCSSAIENEFIRTKDGKNRYYCSAKGWMNVTGWSWYTPREFFLNPAIEYGTMTDSRDNKVYKTVEIRHKLGGRQTWMAENLNYYDENHLSVKENSWCFGKLDNKDSSTCNVAGRLYTWAAAIDSVAFATDADNPQDCGYGRSCSLPTKVQGICPTGWHLPSMSEWETLFRFVGDQSTAGNVLKSAVGWNRYEEWNSSPNGTDAFGFAAIPATVRDTTGKFMGEGFGAAFWSSTENEDNKEAYGLSFFSTNENVLLGTYDKRYGYSVRCIKD